MLHIQKTRITKNLAVILPSVVLQILLGVVLAHLFLLFHNTLHENGNWVSSKMNLEKGVMGAQAFFFQHQSLARGRLNLGAWHGFQEVLFKEKLDVREIEFDFNLGWNSYLNLIIDKHEDGFSGIRLSANRHFESTFFAASDIGDFTERRPLAISTLRDNLWHQVRLHFGEGTVSVFIDGEELGSFSVDLTEKRQIGFRGGLRKALVDNVVIRQHSSNPTVYESFSNRKHISRITILSVLLVFVLNAAVFLFLRATARPRGRYAALYIISINMVLLVISSWAFGLQYLRGSFYPKLNDILRAREERNIGFLVSEVTNQIRTQHDVTPNGNTYRILFIGTSQTWGAGATKKSKTFVEVIEHKLNESGPQGIHFECVNGGIGAVASSVLLDVYKTEWLKLEPRIVIINLSNNDPTADWFALNLDEMIEISLTSGIQPILVLEPNSVENSDRSLFMKHDMMRRVAASYGVPTIDMHAYLRRKYDEGFLWWDFVHLTDFGQQLFAERVYEELLGIIEEI
jgi:lysophospholipase L1-like esterase